MLDPAAVLAEASRVLRPGGLLYVEVPFLFEYHPNPGDYLRFTRMGLERALGGFTSVEVGTLIGPWAALSSVSGQALADRLVRQPPPNQPRAGSDRPHGF